MRNHSLLLGTFVIAGLLASGAALGAGGTVHVGDNCIVTGVDENGNPIIKGPIPVLNRSINDALLDALKSLRASDPTAYAAFAKSLHDLPRDQRDVVTQGLGLSVTSTTVTRSVDYSLMLQMNSNALKLSVSK
jgi:hypothetical protein